MRATKELFEDADRILSPTLGVPVPLTTLDCAYLAFLIELKVDELDCAGADNRTLGVLRSIDHKIGDAVRAAIDAEIERQHA